MFEHIDLYLEMRDSLGNFSLPDLATLVREELGGDLLFDRMVELSIDPADLREISIPIVKDAIRKEEIARERIRVNNRLVALGKDREIILPPKKVGRRKVSEHVKCRAEHVEMFPCDAHPYTLDRLKRAIRTGEILAQANAAKNGGNQTFAEK